MFSLQQISLNMKVFQECPVCGGKNVHIILTSKDQTVSKEIFGVWKCKDCTLRFTQSIPGEDEISKYYRSENYISHSDTSSGFINSLYHKVRKFTLRSKFQLIKSKTGISRGGNILDVGAGTGAFLNMMHQKGWDTTGIEPDETARNNAAKLYNIVLLPADEFYHLKEGSFTAITLWHTLEHVYELHAYMEQLKKLLKPKGVLFIAVPNHTSYDAKYYKQSWAGYDVPRHLYHFSPASMKRLLSMHDLKLVNMKPMWFDSFYISLLSEKNKTGRTNKIRAFARGLASNLKALFFRGKCSSLIYVVKKQS